MWQGLLSERFRLSVHRSSREMPVYQLVVAKGGLKIKQFVEEHLPATSSGSSQPPADGAPRGQIDKEEFPVLPPGRVPATIIINGRVSWRMPGATMAQFAAGLVRQVAQPVVDATGLAGKYDFFLSWVIEGAAGRGTNPTGSQEPRTTQPNSLEFSGGLSIFGALQRQLGLKLEEKKAPVDVLVVDHVDRIPTEN